MRTPGIYERVQVLEDETALLDSSLDAKTALLWAEITKLRSELEQLKAAQQREGE